MKKALLYPLIISALAIGLLYWTSLWVPVVLVFIPGVLISCVFYFRTAYKKTPEPKILLPLYLLALGIQFLHFAEEYITGFNVKIATLFGQSPYPIDKWLLFNMIAYFVFILGGIILYKRIKELMIIPLFFILMGVVFNGVIHVVVSIYLGGYFPGLYTAILYVLIAPVILKHFWQETVVAAN